MSTSEAMPLGAASRAEPRRAYGQAAVVAVAAVFSAVLFVRRGLSADTLLDAFVVWVLVAISRHDLERRVIPNRIVLPALALALAVNIALHPDRWWVWLLASFGTGWLFLVFARWTHGGLGMGDVKLIAFLGAALGSALLPALVIGTTGSALVSVAVFVRHGAEGRNRTIPLGPFLAVGAIATLLLL